MNDVPRQGLRKDAQQNIEKLKAAAIELFRVRGLGAPLEDIAQYAGVSTGTLYNRFGSREALIDAVLPELAESKLAVTMERVRATHGAWERFATFVEATCSLQAEDPVFNDVASRRYPDSAELQAVCNQSLRLSDELIKAAQDDGSLRGDFTSDDLHFLFWSNALLIRNGDANTPESRRKIIGFLIDGLKVDKRNALS